MSTRLGTNVFALASAWFLVFGAWPFFAPGSFYEIIAPWPPYNEHLLRDAGAFSVGIGCAICVMWTSWKRLAVLVGATTASVMHLLAHVIDSDQGGRSSDPYVLGGFAFLLAIALLAEYRAGRV